MPITPGGRFSPGDSDDYDLVTDLAAMQVSNEMASATEIAAIPRTYAVGTNAQRLALGGANLFKGVRFYATDTNIEWLYTGTLWTWVPRNLARLEMPANQVIAAGAAVVLSGLTTTLTTPAGRVRMTFSAATFSGAVTDLIEFTFRDGTTRLWPVTASPNSSPSSAGTGKGHTYTWDVDVAAGSHTFNVSAQVAAGGNITVSSTATQRSALFLDWLG